MGLSGAVARIFVAVGVSLIACSDDARPRVGGGNKTRWLRHDAREALTPGRHERASEPAPPAPPAPSEAETEPTAAPTVLVDHAWLREAEDLLERDRERALLERLRLAVLGGESLRSAWDRLHVDGTRWHVAEREAYPAEVVDGVLRGTKPGEWTELTPGHGGTHLMRLIERR